jgi:hypothetical protein
MRVIHRGRCEAQTDDSRIRIREKNQRVSDEEGADPAETGRKNWFYQRLFVKSRKYKKGASRLHLDRPGKGFGNKPFRDFWRKGGKEFHFPGKKE